MHILYEDSALVVVIKQPGQLSEAADGSPDSLITLLKQHFCANGDTGSQAHPIHRLDRNVGGVMVYAKNPRWAARLSEAVRQNQLTKEYFALVHGTPEASGGILTDLLWKDSRKNKTFVVTRPRKGVREARLAYHTLAEAEGCTLVQIRLYTGRSHQIRVQFASRRLPLVGDGKYGARDNRSLALYSCRLTFPHPETGRTMTFYHSPGTLEGVPIPESVLPLEENDP